MGTSEGIRLESDRTREAALSSWSTRTRLPWMRVVQLAEQLEAEHVTPADIDPLIATRLADAVLHFQQQLLGGERTIVTRTPDASRPESDRTPGAEDASGPHPPRPPWAVVVDLARQLDAEYARWTEIDAAIGPRLARAVLDFHAHLGSAVVTAGGRGLDEER